MLRQFYASSSSLVQQPFGSRLHLVQGAVSAAADSIVFVGSLAISPTIDPGMVVGGAEDPMLEFTPENVLHLQPFEIDGGMFTAVVAASFCE